MSFGVAYWDVGGIGPKGRSSGYYTPEFPLSLLFQIVQKLNFIGPEGFVGGFQDEGDVV